MIPTDMKYRVLLLVLLLAAAALSYAIYAGKTGSLVPGGRGAKEAGSGPTIEEQREAFLTFDPKTATFEQREQHEEAAKTLAVPANTIEIGRCALDPAIASVEGTSTIAFRNNATGTATVTIQNTTYNVPAGGSKEVRVDVFGKPDRLYGYGCSSPGGSARGFILVR